MPYGKQSVRYKDKPDNAVERSNCY